MGALLPFLLFACAGSSTPGTERSPPDEPSTTETAAPEDTSPAQDTGPDAPPDTSPGDTDTGDTSHSDTEVTDIDPPERMVFVGNSFTNGGPIPEIVDLLANDAGWPDPDVTNAAIDGESLHGHRDRDSTLEAVDEGDWDILVLQEFSTKPTDNAGDPEEFKEDATWWHDRARDTSPEVAVVLYETWARHADHSIYPDTFTDPGQMQAQLRTHYNDAADVYMPTHATATPPSPITVAPAGDAWEAHLAEPAPLRLHADDDYHAGTNGQYLNALVLYGTIYQRSVQGRTPWLVPPADAARLQATADAMTGFTTTGGPAGTLPDGMEPGQVALVDLGSDSDETHEVGWNNLTSATSGTLVNLTATDGGTTSVDVYVSDAFGGVNTSGIEGPLYPASATTDSLYCGSFDDHADGLLHPGALLLWNLDPAGSYTLRLTASRSGDDGGLGRLTRYTVAGRHADLEVADNTTDRAVFSGVSPSPDGSLVIDVAVSPAGTGRFCYLGVLELERE